ncbi:amidohydrolase [Sinosporangium siamense]|uniref:Amidohydrolase n=1 Tax=Sinosporangium siamense TaxID=1367973 RepID=A0A919VAL6_9ACTN|nr:amidohydrolase [Sinosporangium siamense]GII95552.1 amidohydrolase [Sinosporangium siamense]
MTSSAIPDRILVNGRITTLAEVAEVGEVSALAIAGGVITSVGGDEEIRSLAGESTEVVDLGGRRVIPGLIDSHVHFVRAGLTWDDEIRWEDVYELSTGLELVAEATRRQPKGSWIRVIGGFDERQFRDGGRGPTRQELDRVAPDHPVYVQMQYTYVQLNTLAMEAMGITEELVASVTHLGRFERDENGELTGRGRGVQLMPWFYRQLPTPAFENQVASTASLSREFARVGLTGCIDGGGFNTGPDVYHPIYETWRRGELSTRVRLFKHGAAPGTEEEDLSGYARFLEPHFGDDMMRMSGIGEVIIFHSHDLMETPGDTSDEAMELHERLLTPFAAKGWTVQIHAFHTRYIDRLLDVWERIDKKHPISGLRWTIVHGVGITEEHIPRLKALGAGVMAQSLMRFHGDASIKSWGAPLIAKSPEMRKLIEAGVPIALGSDGMRGASYNPFTSLEWFLTGLTVAGTPTLAQENLLTREEALRGYTVGSAWCTFEDESRGRLVPGNRADLVVLSKDYLTIPTEEIHTITSELTLLDGRTVWTSGIVG